MFRTTIYLLRKIQLHPGASFFIASLITGIVSYESYSIFNPTVKADKNKVIALSTIDSSKSPNVLKPNTETVASIDSVDLEKSLVQDTYQTFEGIDNELASLLSTKQWGKLRKRLLELASIAVNNKDENRLGYILNLLGQVAIQEQDLHSAKVYLAESKNIFEGLQDEIGVAQVNLQLGRAHLKSREIARTAGTAYDELQVGRWYLAKNLLQTAEQYIKESIERNLSISRYGSAASAYESLARLHLKQNDTEKAQQALYESARMFASSGKIDRARQVLQQHPSLQVHSKALQELNQDIQENYASYREDVLQIERARDYRRLFRYYRSSGDQVRAWRFRLLANESLANVSKRTLFHRQQGVLAILYNSNDAKAQAENYFVQAKQTFDLNGMLDLSSETEQLNQQIF